MRQIFILLSLCLFGCSQKNEIEEVDYSKEIIKSLIHQKNTHQKIIFDSLVSNWTDTTVFFDSEILQNEKYIKLKSCCYENLKKYIEIFDSTKRLKSHSNGYSFWQNESDSISFTNIELFPVPKNQWELIIK